jgi:hypothetical protein
MQRLVDLQATQTELIGAMRDAGLSIIPSIRLLVRFYGLSWSEAKAAVHLSETWADRRKSNDALHEAAFAAAKEFGFEEVVEAKRQEVSR